MMKTASLKPSNDCFLSVERDSDVSQYNWSTCPHNISRQLEAIVAGTCTRLSGSLVGVYLHGSLATGCFNPKRSDIDLLVVISRPLTSLERREFAELILELSRQPSPVEVSIIRRYDMVPWKYPTPFDFHYSECWRESRSNDLIDGSWKTWESRPLVDEDLAAHIAVMNHRGVALYGPPIPEVFPKVPKQDYLASVLSDVLSPKYGLTGEKIQYPVNAILNACRTLAYLRTGNVLSKDEGGNWALDALPEQFSNVIIVALDSYRNRSDDDSLDTAAMACFAEYARNEIETAAESSD